MKSAALLLLLVLLLSAATASGQKADSTIDYGRSWPRSMTVDPARGILYVDGMSGIYPPTGYSFGIVNVSTHLVERVLPLNVTSGEMTIDESSGDVYVAGYNSIEVFDGRTQEFARNIFLGVQVFYVLYDSASRSLFVSNGLNKVFEVDPLSGRILASATVGNGAEGMALDQKSGELYVADYLSDSISVLRADGLAPVTTIELPALSYPAQIVLNSNTGKLYSTTGINSIDVVDTSTNRFLGSVTVAPLASNSTLAIALDQKADRVYVLTGPGTTIVQVDGAGDTVRGRFSVSSDAYELAVNQDTQELYVTVYHQIDVFPLTQSGTTGVVSDALLVLLLAVGVVVAVILARRASRAAPPNSSQDR
ncbi:MAG: YncE family protein [Thaumarchaeota archaeon]|nr:YncE family protein [Nitrososphaerota archaeon]